jgi:hypothetical protein
MKLWQAGNLGRNLASYEDLPWLLLLAIKNHLPRLRAVLIAELADDIDGAELFNHFDQGRGALCKDPVFVTELITILNEKSNKTFGVMDAANKNLINLNMRAPAKICNALTAKNLCPLHANDALLAQVHRALLFARNQGCAQDLFIINKVLSSQAK